MKTRLSSQPPGRYIGVSSYYLHVFAYSAPTLTMFKVPFRFFFNSVAGESPTDMDAEMGNTECHTIPGQFPDDRMDIEQPFVPQLSFTSNATGQINPSYNNTVTSYPSAPPSAPTPGQISRTEPLLQTRRYQPQKAPQTARTPPLPPPIPLSPVTQQSQNVARQQLLHSPADSQPPLPLPQNVFQPPSQFQSLSRSSPGISRSRPRPRTSQPTHESFRTQDSSVTMNRLTRSKSIKHGMNERESSQEDVTVNEVCNQ